MSAHVPAPPPAYPAPPRHPGPVGRVATPHGRGPAGIVGLSLAAGLTTGAVSGLLVVAVVVVTIAIGSGATLGETPGILVVYGGFAVIIGATVGLVVSPVLAVVLVAARPLVAGSRWRARGIAAAGAALGAAGLSLVTQVPPYAAAPFALFAALGAAVWARRIMGL